MGKRKLRGSRWGVRICEREGGKGEGMMESGVRRERLGWMKGVEELEDRARRRMWRSVLRG